MLTNFICAFLCMVALTALVHAQRQSGFISIDCGIPEDAVYTDKITGIDYVSDANSIETGINHNILAVYNSETLEQQFSTVRSFPEGERNCYTLNLTSRNVKFFIRARFMYGNYDGKDILPSFNLMLEADVWDSVELEDSFTIVTKEIIHIPQKNYIYVCLLNTNTGTPFISALEVRPLPNSTYQAQSGSLLLSARLDIGSTANETTRYKNDFYDRIWSPFSLDDSTPVSTSLSVDTSNHYKPPSSIMMTAAIPASASDSLRFLVRFKDSTSKCYAYFHFAGVESFKNNQTRELTIYVNEILFYGPFYLGYLSIYTVYTSAPFIGKTLEFKINKTEKSTRPPIINALEIFEEKELSQLLTSQQDVDAIMNIKSKYGLKKNWQGDPCVPEAHLWQGLNCSINDYDPPRITSLNLSSSGIAGEIASDISSLTSLQILDLSNNNLTGLVPQSLSDLHFLRLLNLTGNNLERSIPAGLIEKAEKGLLSLSVDGNSSVLVNSNLCLSDSCNKKKNKFIVPVVASVVTFSILLAALAILWNFRRKKQAKKNKSSITMEVKNRKFSYSDVMKMTNNFERVLGKGGFGTVYHGYLEGNQVAVKMLSPSSVQGYKQFQAEVQLLVRAHHKNLTILVGYCDEGTTMGLIYEFMANGNLQERLLEGKADFLSWEGRLRIAVEAAQGLEYLHNGCKPPIVHRDVKSANILLNEKFQAKLADFGFSRIFPVESGTHLSTTVVGTPGYLDPEYYIHNRLTEKSDVYSFGAVLLELITGKPAIEKTPERSHIKEWISFMLSKGDIKNIVDERLKGDFDINTLWKFVEIAMACVSPTSARRPTMNQVVIELNNCLAMEIARTQVREAAATGSNELMLDLNLQSEIFPVAR